MIREREPQIGRGLGLINEHEPARPQIELSVEPAPRCLRMLGRHYSIVPCPFFQVMLWREKKRYSASIPTAMPTGSPLCQAPVKSQDEIWPHRQHILPVVDALCALESVVGFELPEGISHTVGTVRLRLRSAISFQKSSAYGAFSQTSHERPPLPVPCSHQRLKPPSTINVWPVM